MPWRLFLRTSRLTFGALVIVAIVVQLADLASKGFRVLSFLKFTIESNAFGALVLLAAATRAQDTYRATLDFLRGAVVVLLAATGIVFATLLARAQPDATLPWVNALLHQVMPILVLLDWLVDPPQDGLTIRRGLLWLAFPLAWMGYTLGRGALTGWYPYPFLDPVSSGPGGVALYSLAILSLMTFLCVLTVVLGNAARGWWRQTEA